MWPTSLGIVFLGVKYHFDYIVTKRGNFAGANFEYGLEGVSPS